MYYHGRSIILLTLLAVSLWIGAAWADVSVQVDVTYSNCYIVSGPLSLGLAALPSDVHSCFIYLSPTWPPAVGPAVSHPVTFASINVGDAHVTADDIQSFSIGYAPVEEQLPSINALSYLGFLASTLTSMGVDMPNSSFEINISGTDNASGQAFHYRCTTSSQTYRQADEGVGCPATPASCGQSAAKGLLLVNEKRAGKEKLVAKWEKGPARSGGDYGNPLSLGATAYTLCVYDDANSLAGQYIVDRAGGLCGAKPCWKYFGKPPGDPKHKGYKFKDKYRSADGIALTQMKAGAAGQSKAVMKGKNNSSKAQSALPTGTAAALSGSTSATIQLHGNDAPVACTTVGLPMVKKNAAGVFKATK
jgi:hypothetical protein